MEPLVWFSIVFLVLLKIPLVYLCWVVWWAVKDPPGPDEGFAGEGEDLGSGEPEHGTWWRRAPKRPPLRRGPHGSPSRRPSPAMTRARTRPPA